MFAQQIADISRASLEKYVLRAREYVKKRITRTCNLTDRLTLEYAILIATAHTARCKLGLNVNEKDIRAILLAQHDEILKEADPAMNLYDCIIHYISVNHFRFPKFKTKFEVSSIEGVEDNGFYYVTVNTFEKIMKSNNFSDVKVSINQLANKNLLEKNKDRNYFTKTVNGLPLKCYKIRINGKESN